MRTLLILFGLIFILVLDVSGQMPTISLRWKQDLTSKFPFEKIEGFTSYDYPRILLNATSGIRDSYTGVFGPKNKEFVFRLDVQKNEGYSYQVSGKSKLGEQIRNLSGKIILERITKLNFAGGPLPIHIIIFNYRLDKPGDRDGDSRFIGKGTVTFYIRDGKPRIYWAASGDLRDCNNMFVGVWNRYHSTVSRKCIFTVYPNGLHNKLQIHNCFYKKDDDYYYDLFNIKDEFRQYSWENFKDDKSSEEKWWKDYCSYHFYRKPLPHFRSICQQCQCPEILLCGGGIRHCFGNNCDKGKTNNSH